MKDNYYHGAVTMNMENVSGHLLLLREWSRACLRLYVIQVIVLEWTLISYKPTQQDNKTMLMCKKAYTDYFLLV